MHPEEVRLLIGHDKRPRRFSRGGVAAMLHLDPIDVEERAERFELGVSTMHADAALRLLPLVLVQCLAVVAPMTPMKTR